MKNLIVFPAIECYFTKLGHIENLITILFAQTSIAMQHFTATYTETKHNLDKIVTGELLC